VASWPGTARSRARALSYLFCFNVPEIGIFKPYIVFFGPETWHSGIWHWVAQTKALVHVRQNSLFTLQKLIIGPIQGVTSAVFDPTSDAYQGATPLQSGMLRKGVAESIGLLWRNRPEYSPSSLIDHRNGDHTVATTFRCHDHHLLFPGHSEENHTLLAFLSVELLKLVFDNRSLDLTCL